MLRKDKQAKQDKDNSATQTPVEHKKTFGEKMSDGWHNLFHHNKKDKAQAQTQLEVKQEAQQEAKAEVVATPSPSSP